MIYGEHIRIPGARPISRVRSSAALEDNWDQRFWLNKIPDYDSKRDPFMKHRRPNSHTSSQLRLCATRAVSRHSRTGSNLVCSSVPRLSRQLKPEVDLTEVRRDLESTWDKEGVQGFHREAYLRHVEKMSAQSALLTMAREVMDLQQRKTPYQQVFAAIRKREQLLTQIKDLENDVEDERLLQLDLRDLLQQLQRVSVEVIENVQRWRELAGSQAVFQWEGRNYLLKMKTDVASVVQGRLQELIPRAENDPLLIRTLAKGKVGPASRQKSKAQDAEVVLAQEVDPEAENRTVSPDIPSIIPLVALPEQPVESSATLSSSFSVYSQSTTELAKLVASDFVTQAVEESAIQLCSEACAELLTAHMTLYTNKILDDVISLVLKEQIPICTQEAYTEEIDREFIVLQQQILETVITREVQNGVDSWALEVVAEEITKEFAAIVKVDDIVQESVAEETDLNNLMIAAIFQQLIDALMREEWLEIMCEDVLSDEILNERLDLLPMSVLKQILHDNPSKHIERMCDHCYTLLLYHYVGEVWLRRVIDECMQEAQGFPVTIDVFPIAEPQRRSTRRVTRVMVHSDAI